MSTLWHYIEEDYELTFFFRWWCSSFFCQWNRSIIFQSIFWINGNVLFVLICNIRRQWQVFTCTSYVGPPAGDSFNMFKYRTQIATKKQLSTSYSSRSSMTSYLVASHRRLYWASVGRRHDRHRVSSCRRRRHVHHRRLHDAKRRHRHLAKETNRYYMCYRASIRVYSCTGK